MEASRKELERFFATVMPDLDELQRRRVAGAIARELGRGGKTTVAAAAGLSRHTVIRAQAEVEAGVEPRVRIRERGAGPPPAVEKQAGLWEALDEVMDPEATDPAQTNAVAGQCTSSEEPVVFLPCSGVRYLRTCARASIVVSSTTSVSPANVGL